MKQLHRKIVAFFLVFFVAGFACAQSEDDGIIDRTHFDTCQSFKKGREYYYRGIYYSSESDLRNAIHCFELHLTEHPQDEYTADYLGYTYYFLYFVYFNKNQTEDVVECLEKALLYLPIDDTIARFEMHYYYGQYLFLGDSLSGIEPDYCEAFGEFNKALAYIDDIDLTDDLLPLYKELYYRHASLLFDSYYNSISLLDTTTFCKEIVELPDWVSCVGEQQLDRCLDDLNHIVGIDQLDSQKNIVDTLALVLLGKCHCIKEEYEKATNYYEKSGITPEQFVLSDDLPSIEYFRLSYIKLGEGNSEQHEKLWKAEADYWYKHYRLLYMDQACYKGKELHETGVLLSYAQTAMAYYLANREYAKGLDFWFKIKNNFSFDGTLKCYQGWCRYFLNDFTAYEDLEFAAALNSKDRLAHLGVLLSNLNNGKLVSSMPLGDTLNTIDTLYYLFGGLSSYYGNDYEAANEHFMAQDSVNAEMQAFCYQMLAEQESDPEQRDAFIERANEYFRKVIAEEDSTGKFSEAPYAYLFLGDKKKAVEIMKHILQTDITLSDSLTCWGAYHQAAEIYAQVGKLKIAKKHLKKSLEYCHNPMILAFIEKAPLLTPIREYVEQEVTKYNQQMEKAESPIQRQTIVCEIPYRKKGLSNVRTINTCYINDSLVEDMLFDPGADYVQLTKKEADRIGITEKDYIGWIPLGSANGKVDPMSLVSLDKLRIDSIELENVQAVINTTPGAPLLLGCTVWNNLTVEMPANKMIIRLTYIKESIEIPEDKKKPDKQ